jgi:fatty acid desaturase
MAKEVEKEKTFFERLRPSHILAFACIAGAVVMACCNIHGWGWLLFVALLIA